MLLKKYLLAALYNVFYLYESLAETIIAQNYPKSNICQGATHTSLVENFFNQMFVEFENVLPACVCVQMCVYRPTYCYPNGCLQKGKMKRQDAKEIYVREINLDSADDVQPKMFVINYEEKAKNHENEYNTNYDEKEMYQPKYLLDLFKGQHQMVFHRKNTAPKIQIQYNFLEQVRNMISGNVKRAGSDIHKNRWPHNKRMKNITNIDDETIKYDGVINHNEFDLNEFNFNETNNEENKYVDYSIKSVLNDILNNKTSSEEDKQIFLPSSEYHDKKLYNNPGKNENVNQGPIDV